MKNLHERLDGATLLALQLVGLTEEEWELLDKLAAVDAVGEYNAIVWHNRPEKTRGKYLYVVSSRGDPIEQAKRSLASAWRVNSTHWVVVLINGRVPFGAEIKPEWREEPCNTKS